MASFGSYLRFITGLLLSLEIMRQAVFGADISGISIWLAAVFILSSAWFFIKSMMK